MTKLPKSPQPIYMTNPVIDSNSLNFAMLNIRSILKKSSDVAELISAKRLDVFLLTETWHTNSSDYSLRRAAPYGYSLIDVPRISTEGVSTTNHGGIALIFRSELRVKPIILNFVPTTFELLACSIRSGTSNVTIIAIYRPGSVPPCATFYDELHSLFEIIATYKSLYVICGDFNIHVDNPSDLHCRQFTELLDVLDMTQHVHQSTHLFGHTLDLLITYKESFLSNITVDPPLLSDHSLITFLFPFLPRPVCGFSHRLARSWKSLDIAVFKTNIITSSICNAALYTSLSVSELFAAYHTVFNDLANKFAPEKLIKIKSCPRTPWFDHECHAARRLVRSAERRFRRSGADADKVAWLNQFQIKRALLANKESSYWSNAMQAHGNNSTLLWKCLKNLLDQNGNFTYFPSELTAVDLSKFFLDKIDSIRASTRLSPPPIFNALAVASLDHFAVCSSSDIMAIIRSFPIKSCSLDPLPASVFQKIYPEIVPFITELVNKSLLAGFLPPCQKTAVVRPILKKAGADPTVMSNYRPISNLSFLSKLIERVVVKQLTTYLTLHNLFPAVQSAYRAFHSTETVLLRITSDIFRATNSSQVTLLALLDLSAAFDCVDHSILLQRLRSKFGLTGTVLNWIFSFLSDRTQYISYNGNVSPKVNVTCGVPQGSVLGPLLFILYTSEILEIAAAHGVTIHCYADDIQLYCHCDSFNTADAENRITRCIADINTWMASNKLKLNPEKTQIMWLGTHQQLKRLPCSTLHLASGQVINPCQSVRDLGVIIDSRLSMDEHVRAIVSSSLHQLRQIRTVRSSLSTEATTLLVHALIAGKIDYCNSILYGVSDKLIRRLQFVQNSAARLVAGRRPYDHITDFIRDNLHWLPIRMRINYKLAVLVYSCLHGTAPIYLRELLIPDAAFIHLKRLRSATRGDLHLPESPSLEIATHSFCYSAPIVWNSLPPVLHDMELSAEQFKKLLKTHLFKIAFVT